MHGIVTSIIENIQVIVEDVHIRYEDERVSHDRIPFSIGIMLESFKLESMDEEWELEGGGKIRKIKEWF